MYARAIPGHIFINKTTCRRVPFDDGYLSASVDENMHSNLDVYVRANIVREFFD